MVVHHMAVPGLQFSWIGFTSEVTKVTPSCPTHFIMYPGSFFYASIYIIVVPLEHVSGGRHVDVVHVVWGGGFLLLHPGLTEVGEIEGVQVGLLGVPESLWGGGGHRSCSRRRS